MNVNSRTIFLPILVISVLIFFIILMLWKRLFYYRRPITPYINPQIAYITQPYQQQPTYLPPLIEQPPPSYYTAMNSK